MACWAYNRAIESKKSNSGDAQKYMLELCQDLWPWSRLLLRMTVGGSTQYRTNWMSYTTCSIFFEAKVLLICITNIIKG